MFDVEKINIYNQRMNAYAKKRRTSKSNSQAASEIQAAIDYGIDISMLVANLRLSCTQRALRHQIALNTIRKLQKAKFL
jgi:hypothetical protein